LPLERIASLVAREPARRFRIPQRGGIEKDNHADLVLVDLERSTTLRLGDLFQRHRLSPYIGSVFHGKIVRTILRGETIYAGGTIVAQSNGKLVRPTHN